MFAKPPGEYTSIRIKTSLKKNLPAVRRGGEKAISSSFSQQPSSSSELLSFS
jgi:hypothetical protein